MKLPPTEAEWLAQEAARRKIMEDYVTSTENPHPYAGMSVLDIIWQDLDDCMDQLMAEGAPDKATLAEEMFCAYPLPEARELADEWYSTLKEWGELRGQAQGLAFAIAILTNPYAADVPAVKKEAMARWESRQKR
jgi:hypothetical protein